MSDDEKYFLSLIADNEALTEDLPDNLAGPVIKFAMILATKIAQNGADRATKEKQFGECMEHLLNLSKAIAQGLENPERPNAMIEAEISAAISAAKQNSQEE